MGVQICQAPVFHTPGILSKKKWPQPSLFSWPLLLLPLPSPRLVLDSPHRPVCCLWSRECQTRAQPCPAALASSRSSTTGRPTSSAPTQTRLLPGAPLPPPAQAPTLTGSMDSVRPPAHPTPHQRPPPPQFPLLPQPQPRRLPAAPRAPSP